MLKPALPLAIALACVCVLLPWRGALAQSRPADAASANLPDDPTEAVAFPVRVDRIDVHGLQRTQRFVVLRELPFAPGDVVDEETFRFGATRLWNVTLFDRVQDAIWRNARTGEVVATYTLEETWTLNPLFSFAIGGNAAWLRVGASDNNVLGRFLELGAQYERFGYYNGFQAWARVPRFLGKRLDWVVIVDRLVRPRPDFADRRLRIGSEVFGLAWQDRLKLTAKLEALDDVLLAPDGHDDDSAPRHWSVLAEFGVRLGRIDTLRVRQKGTSLEVRQTLVATPLQPLAGFAQGWLEFLALQPLGERWVVGTRLQMGVQGEAPPYLNFYLGGLTVVRGYIDNFVRTQRYALVNGEVRYTAYDSKWFSIIPAAFIDAAVARRMDGRVQAMLSSGVGARFLLPWMVKTGLRLDAAVPILSPPCASGFCPGLSVGVYQFF